MSKIFFILNIVLLVTLSLSARAAGAFGEDFIINMNPESPGPNETVEVSLVSYSFDINRSMITWTLNGKKISEGRGQKTASFKTGLSGAKTNLSVTVTTEDGARLSKNASFLNADIDLVAEADTYTPATYRGKALPSIGSFVKVVAVPHFFVGGERIPSSKLLYDWRLNDKKLQTASGYGKDYIIFKSFDFFNEESDADEVRVMVSNFDATIVAESSINVTPFTPKVMLYSTDPLEGTYYNRALENEVKLKGEEVGIKAEPFFFSKSSVSSLSYAWSQNNKESGVGVSETPSIMNFRLNGGGGGRSEIGIRVENPLNLLQTAGKIFTLIF